MSIEQEKVLAKVEALLKVAQGELTREDFINSFEKVVNLILRVEKRNIKAVEDMEATYILIKKVLKEGNEGNFETLKGQILKQMSDFKGLHAEEMRGFEERMGKKMDEMEANMPLMSHIMEECMKMMPEPVEPDTADDIRNKLEVLPDGEKLKIDAIENLRKELDAIRNMRARAFGGGGTSTIGVQAALGRIQVIEEEITFSGTTGALSELPASGTVKLFRGGVRMQEGTGKDYTISGATITLATAAIEGEVFVADFERV